MNSVFTLRDLASWTHAGPALAVLGHPIGHSLSPAMHNAALGQLARHDPRFADWKYFRLDVPPDDLPQALERLHERGFHGLNLTVPHKIMAFDCVAEVDHAARPVGAVNTLRRIHRGWEGFNTDGYGLAAAIQETLGCRLAGAPVVLLGAGGAARGAAVECLRQKCSSLWISNRSRGNLGTLFAQLTPLAKDVPVSGFAPGEFPPGLPSDAIVINATSLGLRPDDPSPLNLAGCPRPRAVFDMIYNPPRTELLRQAEALGIPCANGLAMLVHQGAKALEIWTGAPASGTAPVMSAALTRA